jgi:hypothetical protein
MASSSKDILHMRCSIGEYTDYDLNAWVGDANYDEQRWVHRENNLHFHNFESQPADYILLDAVGGTNLYINADLIRKGLHFPPIYLVGTAWNKIEGYDGVETEGLCYLARGMGSQCWGMPHMAVRHSIK